MALFKVSEDFFGLDLASDGVRLSYLKAAHPKPALLSYSYEPLPPGLLTSENEIDFNKVIDAIRKVVQASGVATKNVVMGLPASSVFVTTVRTPKVSHNDLAKAIRYQAEQHIPMALDQVKLDWYVVSENDREMEVLMVAAPVSVVNRYLNYIQRAGLEIFALEINAIALCRVLSKPNQSILVANFDYLNTEIAVCHDHILRLARSLGAGESALVRAVEQEVGIDTQQARQFLYKFGMHDDKLDGSVYKAIKPVVDSVVEEIKKSINYYQENSKNQVSKVVLSGTLAGIPELGSYMTAGLSLPVEVSNPWQSVAYQTAQEAQLMQIGHQFTTSVGLAMRGISE